MAHSLHKGQRAEREVIHELQPIIDHVWTEMGREPPQLERRGLGLSGQDIVGLDWLSLEVKHREQLAVEQWWQQCVAQSKRRNNESVPCALLYKKNHVPWRARALGGVGYPPRHECVVDISMEDFKWWFYHLAQVQVQFEAGTRRVW